MSKTVVALAFAALAWSSVCAQDLSKMAGTVYVTADTLSTQGKLSGCALQYQALGQDFRYSKGLVMIAGSINLNVWEKDGQKAMGLLFKMGLKDLVFGKETNVEPPVFAYASSKNGTTAESVFDSTLSDTPGYMTYAVRMDTAVFKLLGDIIDGGPISLAFNRKKGGMDVVFPLDLHVEDATFAEGGLRQTRSNKALLGFSECFTKVAALFK